MPIQLYFTFPYVNEFLTNNPADRTANYFGVYGVVKGLEEARIIDERSVHITPRMYLTGNLETFRVQFNLTNSADTHAQSGIECLLTTIFAGTLDRNEIIAELPQRQVVPTPA